MGAAFHVAESILVALVPIAYDRVHRRHEFDRAGRRNGRRDRARLVAVAANLDHIAAFWDIGELEQASRVGAQAPASAQNFDRRSPYRGSRRRPVNSPDNATSPGHD